MDYLNEKKEYNIPGTTFVNILKYWSMSHIQLSTGNSKHTHAHHSYLLEVNIPSKIFIVFK